VTDFVYRCPNGEGHGKLTFKTSLAPETELPRFFREFEDATEYTNVTVGCKRCSCRAGDFELEDQEVPGWAV